MKRIVVILILTSPFLCSVRYVNGMTCSGYDVKDAFQNADVVFTGQIDSVILPGASNQKSSVALGMYLIKFKIQESWKGVYSSHQDVWIKPDAEVVPNLLFGKGDTVLVYARYSGQQFGSQKRLLMISSASRTVILDDFSQFGCKRSNFGDIGIGQTETQELKGLRGCNSLTSNLSYDYSDGKATGVLQFGCRKGLTY